MLLVLVSAGSAHALDFQKQSPKCLNSYLGAEELPDALGGSPLDEHSLDGVICVKLVGLKQNVLDALSEMFYRRHENQSDYDRWTTSLYILNTKFTQSNSFSWDQLKTWMDALDIPERQRQGISVEFFNDYNSSELSSHDVATDSALAAPVLDKLKQLLDGKSFMRVKMHHFQEGDCPGCGLYREHVLYFLNKRVVYMRGFQHDA
tara:strand:+ start:40300 stop:40914 length:615 start_codon:yes stop_codon:yes gene_type:complete